MPFDLTADSTSWRKPISYLEEKVPGDAHGSQHDDPQESGQDGQRQRVRPQFLAFVEGDPSRRCEGKVAPRNGCSED
jgi:hypothetical protein